MSIQTILPIDHHRIAALSQSRQEPDWMLQLRQDALAEAEKLTLPKLEKMHIDRWNLDTYGVHGQLAELNLEQLPQQILDLLSGDQQPDNVVVQTNSGGMYRSLSAELASQGVIFTDMATAIRQHGDLIRPYFMKAVQSDENLLTALHASLWSGGVFLYVPKNVVIDEPLQALFYADDVQAVFAPHVLVLADKGSSVTYVDHYASPANLGGSLVHSGVAEVFVKDGATVHFASTRNLSAAITDLSYRRSIVEKDGNVHWIVGEMGLGNGLSETTSILQGDGSSSDAKIICVGTEEQQLSLTTKALHIGRASTSDMITRGVMRDKATAIVNAVTKIEKGATGANGEQTARMLMLSPQARGDANPILLIDEDDVTAGHAASAGQVNAEQIHYLMSRGITREQAIRLIIYGFLAPVVSEIPISNLQKQLQTLVERKLGQ